MSPLRVLGIETSCDETAVAIVASNEGALGGRIVEERLLSQLEDHAPYGGVVPEIAARAHLSHLDRLVAETMAGSGLGWDDLDAVAATAGPGLIGGVIVGVMTAKSIALARGLPFVAVNHLEGHALTARLTATQDDPLDFPYLLLLVSGGHCQFLAVEGVGRYTRLGTTIDDAAGEAFDKTAKLLGLGYPGGPAVEQAAMKGDATRFDLPRPLKGRDGCDFSFAGLKTAVRRLLEEGTAEALPPGPLKDQDTADLAASFQAAVADVLADRSANAIATFRARHPGARHMVVAGGVAANAALRARLDGAARDHGLTLIAPPMALCTDNAAMIAWAGLERFAAGFTDSLDIAPRPRWPLEELQRRE